MTVRLLVFDDELLSRSKSGAVWGRVYFDLGNNTFPDPGWSDMVVAFAVAWQAALVEIARLDNHKERVCFMDGPFFIDVTLCSEGLVSLDFVHNDVRKHSLKTRMDELLRDAISVGNYLLSICKQHGWLDDRDIQELMEKTRSSAETLAALK